MLRGIDGFAGRASLRTWLFRILINCARANRRHERHAVTFSDLGNAEGDDAPSVEPERFHPADQRWAGHWSVPPRDWPEERLLAAETLERVQRALVALPPRQRAVLTLRDIEGWPAAEVCRVVDISEANERVLLHRARSHVRRELETYLTSPEGAAS
jgi:RNA polymerase sigma-70 factor (ECF subfamily)